MIKISEEIRAQVTNAREVRTFADNVEVRKTEDGAKYIAGYAARFNVWSEVLGYWAPFKERILPGAFAGVLKDDVRGLFNHNSSLILGRTTSGTLSITEDELGLRYAITPPDTSYAKDLLVTMERGDVTQSSFAFEVDFENDGEEWEYDEDQELWLRTIKKCARLYDVSPVTFPAYPQTDSVVAVKRSFDLFRARTEKPPEKPPEAKPDDGRKRRLMVAIETL